jgi:ribonuclease HI
MATECFLQLLKDSTKNRHHRRDRAAERTHFLQTLESVDDDAVIYYTDGSSLGNPGPAGAGYACYCDGTLVGSASVSLGETSNNVAELHGLHEALTDALNRSDSRGRCPPKKLYLFIDNLYALNVSTGKWKAKAHRPLVTSIHERHSAFPSAGSPATPVWMAMRKLTDSPSRAHRPSRRSALPSLPHQPGGAHKISRSLEAPARPLPHRRHLLVKVSALVLNPELSRLASTFPYSTPRDQGHAHPTNASTGYPIGSTGSPRDHPAFAASTFPPGMRLSRPSGSRLTKWAKSSTSILLTFQP